jgi:hypothetical protein
LPQKRRRERYKGSAVRQAIEDAGIDLAITRLAPKAIASQIAAKLPFAISTPQADEALRKMVARQIKEARSAQ